MAFIRPKAKSSPVPAPAPAPAPATAEQHPTIPSGDLEAMALTFDKLSPEGRVSLLLPYMGEETQRILADGMLPHDRYSLLRKLLDAEPPVNQADAIIEVIAPYAGNDKDTRAAAARIGDAFACHRDPAAVDAEHVEWFAAMDVEKLVAAADEARDTPMSGEATAERVNDLPYLFRDRWIAQFLSRLSPASIQDLGAYWHP